MIAAIGLLLAGLDRPQFISGAGTAPEPAPTPQVFGGNRPANLRSSGDHREVTVYNQGFGLIKERRVLHLHKGPQTVEVENVAAEIDPSSVGVLSLGAKDAFELLEQNYQYDLISSQAILAKSVGQRVRFIRTIAAQRDVLHGTLISAPTAIVSTPGSAGQDTYNGMVIRTDDGRIVLDPSGEIEVKSVPAGLITQPTLLWDLDAPRTGDAPVELSYIFASTSETPPARFNCWARTTSTIRRATKESALLWDMRSTSW